MTAELKLVAAIALLLAGACAPVPAQRGAVSRLQPTTVEAVHSYRFNECSGTIPEAGQRGIRTFLNDLRLTPEDVIIASVPKGRTPTRDAQRLRMMQQMLYGTPAQVRILAERDFRDKCRSESEGIIRVVRTLDVSASCQDGELATGCANGRNLAKMISYPSDTFLPRQTSPIRGSGIRDRS